MDPSFIMKLLSSQESSVPNLFPLCRSPGPAEVCPASESLILRISAAGFVFCWPLATGRWQLEPFCGRERSQSPQAKCKGKRAWNRRLAQQSIEFAYNQSIVSD